MVYIFYFGKSTEFLGLLRLFLYHKNNDGDRIVKPNTRKPLEWNNFLSWRSSEETQSRQERLQWASFTLVVEKKTAQHKLDVDGNIDVDIDVLVIDFNH